MGSPVEKYSTLARALLDAADDLQRRVDKLRHDGNDLLDRANSMKSNEARTGAAPHLVNLLKARGSNDPIRQAAERLGARESFVAAHYEIFNKRLKVRSKRARDRRIVTLARSSTNAEISSETGLSVRQIQRILKAADLGEYAKR